MLGAFLLFGVEYITFLIVPYKQKARKPLPALRATGVCWIDGLLELVLLLQYQR